MPHTVEAKDGQLFTIFSDDDLLDIVSQYAGPEIRKALEESHFLSTDEKSDFEHALDLAQRDCESICDYYRSVLGDIQDQADQLHKLLNAPRLNRKLLGNAVEVIHLLAYSEM